MPKPRLTKTEAERRARTAAAASGRSYTQELSEIASTFTVVSDYSSSGCDTGSSSGYDGGSSSSADCGGGF